jgi:hypothetical protein
MVLFGLLASGCTTQDELEYDVPARSEARSAELKIDFDGTPVILVQVAMNYGTTGEREWWQSKYRTSNVQSIAFTERNGAWKSHSFRNLQNDYSGGSFLLQNREGKVLPLIRNRARASLFARSGEDWVVRSSTSMENMYVSPTFGYGFPGLLILGDSAWQALENGTDDGKVFLRSSTGERLQLDTNAYANPVGYFYGVKENHLIATRFRPNYGPTVEQPMSLVCYSWPSGPGKLSVRRRTLVDTNESKYMSFSNVQGELRVFVTSSLDSLGGSGVEYAFRGDDFIRLGSKSVEPPKPDTSGGFTWAVASGTGPDGCVHKLVQPSLPIAPRDSGVLVMPSLETIPFYVHLSSCVDETDTLFLPEAVRQGKALFQSQGSSTLEFTKDGDPMIAFIATTPKKSNPDYTAEEEAGPSWIYFARWNKPGKWTLDTIAEY